MPDPVPVPADPKPLAGPRKALGLILSGVVSAVVSAVVASAVGHAPAPGDAETSPLTASVTVTPPDGTPATGTIPVGTPATVLVKEGSGYVVTIGGEAPTPTPTPVPPPTPTPVVTGTLWAVLVWDKARPLPALSPVRNSTTIAAALKSDADAWYFAMESADARAKSWGGSITSTPAVLYLDGSGRVLSTLAWPFTEADIVGKARSLRGAK